MFTHSYKLLIIVLLFICSNSFGKESVKKIIIEDFEKGTEGWEFTLGSEVKGAVGNFAQDSDVSKKGSSSAWIEGEFENGGQYVGVKKKFELGLSIEKVEFWVKTSDFACVAFRVTGADGQTFHRWIKLNTTPEWQKVLIDGFTNTKNYWGGKKDGTLRFPVKEIMIILDKQVLTFNRKGKKKSGQLWIDHITGYSKK